MYQSTSEHVLKRVQFRSIKKKKKQVREYGFEFWTPPCTIHLDKKESYGKGSQAGVQSILYLRGTTFKVHTKFHYTLEKSSLEFMYGHTDLNENVIMIKYKYLVFWK